MKQKTLQKYQNDNADKDSKFKINRLCEYGT